MRAIFLLLILLPFATAQAQPLALVSNNDLTRLQQLADRCDSDVLGVPNTDACVPAYNALIQHYGGYPQFRAATLERLHQIATRCDADTSGVPDADTCVPAYARLINAYGGYQAYRTVIEARKTTN